MMKTLAAEGDSQTDIMAGWGVEAWNVWPAQLAAILSASTDDNYQSRIFGVSGETTRQMLNRAGNLSYFDAPEIAVVAGGVNDPGASITSADTTLNHRSIIMSLKHGARGDGVSPAVSVTGQANLPTLGMPGQRYVVESDTSTTGGAAAWAASHAPTITGTASGPTVWEHRYTAPGELGWGRVAVASTPPTFVKKIVVLGAPYLNWTAGGDTLATPDATRAAVRAAQTAAVTAENVNVGGVPTVVFADLYALMKARIQAGTDVNFASTAYDQTKSWHATQNNQHFSAYGHTLAASAVKAAIPAEWLA